VTKGLLFWEEPDLVSLMPGLNDRTARPMRVERVEERLAQCEGEGYCRL
jgi:hypothetical protein